MLNITKHKKKHNKTQAIVQTTEGKGEPNIVSGKIRNGHHNTELRT
jgi:hypothetical protein